MERATLSFTNWADVQSKPKTAVVSERKGYLERLAWTAGFLDSREDSTCMEKRIKGVERFHYFTTSDGNYVILIYDDPNKVETARVFDCHQTEFFVQLVDVSTLKPVYKGKDVEDYLKMKILCRRNIQARNR